MLRTLVGPFREDCFGGFGTKNLFLTSFFFSTQKFENQRSPKTLALSNTESPVSFRSRGFTRVCKHVFVVPLADGWKGCSSAKTAG